MAFPAHLTAAVDQAQARTVSTLDQLVATAREMAADPEMGSAERVALMALALWDVLGDQDNSAGLAALAAVAVLRLADQPGGEPR